MTKTKKVKDYISPEGKRIIKKVLNDFSKRKRKLDMSLFIENSCGTVCCFAGAITIEKIGAQKTLNVKSVPSRALDILGVKNKIARSRLDDVFYTMYWTDGEDQTYVSGHKTRALRMAVKRTLNMEV